MNFNENLWNYKRYLDNECNLQEFAEVGARHNTTAVPFAEVKHNSHKICVFLLIV